jgi:hypothetical protein
MRLKHAFDPLAGVDLARKAEQAGKQLPDNDGDGLADRLEQHPIRVSVFSVKCHDYME